MCPGEISSGKAHVADRPGKPLGVLFWRRRGGRERMVRGGSEEVGGYRLLHTKEKSKEPITGSSLVIKGRARRLEGAGRKQLPELSLGRNPPPNNPPPRFLARGADRRCRGSLPLLCLPARSRARPQGLPSPERLLGAENVPSPEGQSPD
ncbi:unnamed protein product [Caretta caretta]